MECRCRALHYAIVSKPILQSMINPLVIVEVVTPLIDNEKSLHIRAPAIVHRRYPRPARLKRSRRSCVDTSNFPRTSGKHCLLVRFASVAICYRGCWGNINEIIALSLVKGLLRYSCETRSTIALALQSPWINSDLDGLEKAYRERVSLT